MARINIEDCWWTDPRRSALIKLIGDEEVADGCALKLWRVAQEFWKHGRKLIPEQMFDLVRGRSELIKVGLVEVHPEGVYVRGSSAYLEWIADRRQNAVAAGKKSAESRRAKSGSAQPKKPKIAKIVEPNSNDSRTELSKVEPSSSSSSSSSYSSSFSSEEGEAEKLNPPIEILKPEVRSNRLIADYCEVFRAKYGSNPTITGKDAGIAKRLAKSITPERARRLLEVYLGMSDAWFLTKRHDLSTFEASLNAVSVACDTGKTFTRTQITQLDKLETTKSQLERIRGGGL